MRERPWRAGPPACGARRAWRAGGDGRHAVGVSFGIYVHVPYCASRCGYCDFNTYVVDADARAGFASLACAEVRLAREALGERARPVGTVFFGGGTPTLLPAADLVR